MNPVPAGECSIYLFEGGREDVQARVNAFLNMQADNPAVELAEVVYSYQGPEYDGRAAMPESATCGVGLVFRYRMEPMSINDQRRNLGRAPIPMEHVTACTVTPEMLFAVVQAANPPQEPTTRAGRVWQRFARRFL